MIKSATLLTLFFVTVFTSSSFAQNDFPMAPDKIATPGSLCTKGKKRYPEGIIYCERNVSKGKKTGIYQKYDQMGYRTLSKRSQFKIDHYIPLCAGGSNEEKNLWPQHQSIYVITDKLEEDICLKMQAGRLLQKKAVALIIEAKNNLDRVEEIQAYVNGL